jgi:hypothetical protein
VKKLFITVTGGVAYVMEDTLPAGCMAEIIDFDDIDAGGDFPSEEARDYCVKRGLYTPLRSSPHEPRV